MAFDTGAGRASAAAALRTPIKVMRVHSPLSRLVSGQVQDPTRELGLTGAGVLVPPTTRLRTDCTHDEAASQSPPVIENANAESIGLAAMVAIQLGWGAPGN